MRKKDELENGCISKAGENEMCFTLLSRDPVAPVVIRAWAWHRVAKGYNESGDPQIIEALECANIMEAEGKKYKL